MSALCQTMMNTKQTVGLHHSLNPGHISGRYSPPYRSPERVRCMTTSTGNFFGGVDDGLLARAEVLAAVDISKQSSQQMMKHDGLYGHTADLGGHNATPSRQQLQMHSHPSFGPTDVMLEQLTSNPTMSLGGMSDHHMSIANSPPMNHHNMYAPVYSHPNPMGNHHGFGGHHTVHHTMHDTECDPRELEAFAERFKQRRIKLGVTQADVGNALANLKLPGVGSLSQSTICRFESLTLSHNNMIALKPILQAWLEEAEKQAREKKEAEGQGLACSEKKRKRTSIAAPEKRSLEAYFAVQPRPSGEKIAQIAEKLDLKKNVVRVWFCNQRQKQKRMKFSAIAGH
ncbi:POU domain, class 4, transcription factor 3-like isoform X1 [Mizuhopecten yessoensis]|uniref:POU domain protein n=1 Tax=Mizuhopecten yessoensis TaxID=6573 RepID=A0A210PJ16_MIZYE|nr:POU domain, class 4, transcription factor 3-like isoform X1 [Mizuhopecten yessoensis]OWF36463.1 POU homeobox transcription factor, Brn3 [Mizuhopecten yessoensis]